MARLALAVLLLAGCASQEAVPVGSATSGMKRSPTADTGKSAPVLSPSKHRPRHRRPTSVVSRSLRRSAVGSRLLTVTAYCYTGSRNAAGKWPTAGTAAANAYPLGTRLLIRGYGVVTVEDRSAPGATAVDIYMGDRPDCLTAATNFGRQTRAVTVLR